MAGGVSAAGPGPAPDAPAGFVDLHSHSTASDGALTPETVVETAARAGLKAFGLTDHDTLAGVAAARDAGLRTGVRVVAGVELSLMDGERELHVLGLHVEDVDRLERELAAVRAFRRTRVELIVERLNALGVPIGSAAVFAESGDGAVGRPHVARALIAGGGARDQRDAFDRYLGAGRPANVEKRRIAVADGIRLVHECGGLAVFAHPGRDGTRERIEALVEAGLDGIEVLHPSHGPDDVTRLMALTEQFGLVPSGGSDFHGATSGSRALGGMNVPLEWLSRHDTRLAARHGATAA
ncbi:MAG: PHP domain-containing protein [Gemmatimonadales bacterium]